MNYPKYFAWFIWIRFSRSIKYFIPTSARGPSFIFPPFSLETLLILSSHISYNSAGIQKIIEIAFMI